MANVAAVAHILDEVRRQFPLRDFEQTLAYGGSTPCRACPRPAEPGRISNRSRLLLGTPDELTGAILPPWLKGETAGSSVPDMIPEASPG